MALVTVESSSGIHAMRHRCRRLCDGWRPCGGKHSHRFVALDRRQVGRLGHQCRAHKVGEPMAGEGIVTRSASGPGTAEHVGSTALGRPGPVEAKII